MPGTRYNKPPKTFLEQIELLQSRGMQIDDTDQAASYISSINYYRLSSYWLPFEQSRNSHQFSPGTTFEAVLASYIFDRKLRLHVLSAVERLEVALRTRFAYVLSHRYGADALENPSVFGQRSHKGYSYRDSIAQLLRDVGRSKETFIDHHRTKYDNLLPPIWACVEIMSLGQLSRWFANIRQRRDRNEIASAFELDEVALASFIHHVTHVRNIAAHHNRLWNRKIPISMKLPTQPSEVNTSLAPQSPKKIYNTLVVLAWVTTRISPTTSWITELKDLLIAYDVDLLAMGFPENWDSFPIWSAAEDEG